MARNPAAIARALTAIANSPATTINPTTALTPATAFHPGTPAGASPLLASYGDWAGGRITALPRDWAVFNAGTFGPLTPMLPMPINEPPPGAERPEPRRWQYPVSWNMPHGVPGDEGLKLASFSQLRTLSQVYSIARACIQTRSQEILSIDWDIVPTPEAEKKMRGDKKARAEFDERRGPVKQFFKKPDPDYFSFSSWLTAALDDLFSVDAMTFYLHPSRRPGKGIGGSDMAALEYIDGTGIRPYVDIRGGKPKPPNPAYAQYMYGVPRVDLMALLMGEDLREIGDGRVKDFRGDQLMYMPYVTRSYVPYGFPPIERALVPILSGLQRQQYQGDYFSEGSIPGLFVSVGDPSASPAQCRALQDALNGLAGDPAWKHRIIVVPGGAKFDPMRPVPLADAFDDLVATQVCMAFDVMPMELGITPRTSTTTSGGAQNQMAAANERINQRKALKPLLKWFKEIFDAVIQQVIGYTDMAWHWEGLEEGDDEAAAVETLLSEVSKGGLSIDEMRVLRGHQPWGLEITSQPVFMTATAIIPLGSIDMKTGQPVGAPPPPGVMGGPAGGGSPSPGGGSGGGGGPSGGAGGAPTPAHAGAAAHEDQVASPPPSQPVKLADTEDLDEVAERANRRARDRRKADGPLTGDVLVKTKGSWQTVKGHPHPGQRYTHGWKPVAGALTEDEHDLADELRQAGAQVHEDGTVTVYHRTSPVAAEDIRRTGRMTGQEDGVFFSTRADAASQATGYGEGVVQLRVPLRMLVIDDVFDDEAHVKIPLRRAGSSIDISQYIAAPDEPMTKTAVVKLDARQIRAGLTRSASPTEPTLDVPAALRELDLIRRRVTKGRSIGDWTVQHLPPDVFTTLTADISQPDQALAAARATVKAAGHRQRRDPAIAAVGDAITTGLGMLADQVAAGTLSTLGFVDAAVAYLETNIRDALGVGATHALADLGRPELAPPTIEDADPTPVTKADGPVGVEGMDPRFHLYAGTANAAYEVAYGLITIGSAEDPDNIVVRWHPRPGACELCAARAGELFTVGTLPGWPGDGGFGKDATVCRGGPNCRCTLSYEFVPVLTPRPPAASSTVPEDARAMRSAMATGNPAAVSNVLDRVASTRAEAQRPYLMRLLKDLLSALARAVGFPRRGGVTKGTDLAGRVRSYLGEHYPAKVLGWVADADWTGPTKVPLADIDMARRPGGRDPAKVRAIAAAVADGETLDPVVLVRTPGQELLQIADGYHRTLGREHAGKKRVLAYVGEVGSDEGPWDRAMHDAKLNKTAQPHWMSQPRDPGGEGGGQWIRSAAGAVEALVEQFGDLVDEVQVNRNYMVQAHDGGGEGHIVLVGLEPGNQRRPVAVLDGLDAELLADGLEYIAQEAREYDGPDEHFTEIVENSGGRPLADGTDVAYDAGGTVHLMVAGRDDHTFDPDDADTLAQALRDMAEAAGNGAAERQEREETERLEREEREAEERERAEAWWEDAGDWYGNNGLTMDSPTSVLVEDVAYGSGHGSTTASVEEMRPLAAAIRELHRRGTGLPEWEPDDDDDLDPDVIDEVVVSSRLTLQLLEDGDMALQTHEGGSLWDVPVWRDNALELAGGLDALHARVLAAPKPVTKAAKTTVEAAGLVVVAADTGRVLMLQRAVADNEDDPAAGCWEPPGGKLDPGEKPLPAARREWAEETGCRIPRGKVTGSWTSPNGVYRGYVYAVPSEDTVPIFDGRDAVTNPDDPDGDVVEALAWWDPAHLADNPALRPELAATIKLMLAAVRTAPVIKCLTCGCDMPHNSHGDRRNITVEDLREAADAAGITVEEALSNAQHTLHHERVVEKGIRDWWRRQPRIPGGRGEHGGEWTTGGAGGGKKEPKTLRTRGPARDTTARPALRDATTTAKVNTAAAAAARKITGRDIPFDFTDSDPAVAREHAEGILRGLEAFPDAPLTGVSMGNASEGHHHHHGGEHFDTEFVPAATRSHNGGYQIIFDRGWSARPDAYRHELAEDGKRRRMGRGRVTDHPAGTALHELAHVVANGAGLNGLGRRLADTWLVEQGHHHPTGERDSPENIRAQAHRDTALGEHLSTYAIVNERELTAEALADVLTHGDDAAELSRRIFDAVEDQLAPVKVVKGQALVKVGPKGYEHGWRRVGVGAVARPAGRDRLLEEAAGRIPLINDPAELRTTYLPGQWQGVPRDVAVAARTRQIYDIELPIRQNLNARYPDSATADWEADLLATCRQIAEDERRRLGPYVLYANGPHQILVFSNDRRVRAIDIADRADKLMAVAPLPGTLRLAVVDKLSNPQGAGQHIRGSGGEIMLSSRVFYDESFTHDRAKMPVARQGSALDYVLAHEWGHAIDDENIEGRRDLSDHPELSVYGHKSPYEGYAEAFAEWYLSGGRTSNNAAQAYAQRYGWKMP